jgi:hypothetical protein
LICIEFQIIEREVDVLMRFRFRHGDSYWFKSLIGSLAQLEGDPG